MTIEELEKKLKINKNTCIHCPTEELAKHVLSILHQLGLKWCSGNSYIIHTGWDNHKENTIYYPFDGERSSLEFAHLAGYKVINAKEFTALHRREELDLESYSPKGELEGFPKEIIARMLECQEEQGNPRDISVFERDRTAGQYVGGFARYETKEGNRFWYDVVNNKDFNLFFKKYPKQDNQESKTAKYAQVGDNAILSDYTSTQSSVEIEINTTEDNSQEFRIGDKVIDILLYEVGVVQDIDYSSYIPYGLSVKFKSGLKSYTINGCYIPEYKNPHLLHYRDNYNYDVIDFNNLPKRQEPKRWRAEKGGEYHYIRFYLEGWFCTSTSEDSNDYYDNLNYNSGNYFRTETEAKIIAQKLNTHFKQLIQEEHE